jgi:nucleotide-binding universal stress UspA family protein
MSVVLAADGSLEAQRAGEWLCGLSLPRWADISIVSVAEAMVGFRADENRLAADVPNSVRRALLAAAEARAHEAMKHLHSCGVDVEKVLRFGHPASEILATAQERDADLIAIGAYGQTRPSGTRRAHLGGVAQKVVKYAPCSVLLVR